MRRATLRAAPGGIESDVVSRRSDVELEPAKPEARQERRVVEHRRKLRRVRHVDAGLLQSRLQARRCAQRGGRLWKSAEIDHHVPLFQVWSEHRDTPWPALLAFWGLPNLQVINRDAHVAKCAGEARDRSVARKLSFPANAGNPVDDG